MTAAADHLVLKEAATRFWTRARRRRVKHLWKRAELLWKTLSSFVVSMGSVLAITLLILGVALLVARITQRAINIEAISVPKALDESGFTDKVVASRLRDAMNQVITEAHSQAKSSTIALQGERPDITVPQFGGLSIDTIASAISTSLHSGNRRTISGEIVRRQDGQLLLELRIDHDVVLRDTPAADPNHPDALFAPAARAVLREIQPFFVAAAAWQHDPRDALREADQIIARLPPTDENVVWAYTLRGDILEERKQFRAARESYEQHALRLDPRFPYARIGLANVLRDEGKLPDAEAELREVIRLDRRVAQAHNNLGVFFYDESKRENAGAEYDKAIWLDFLFAMAQNGVGSAFYDWSKRDRAEAEFREAIRLDPQHAALAHANLGNVLRDERQHDQAEAEYRAALRLDPRFAGAHSGLGDVFTDQGQRDRAEAEYREVIRLDPRNAYAHLRLGVVLSDEGKRNEAAAEFNAVHRLVGTNAAPDR
jgi:tetratricopeptide (TPR) repeat protein